MVDLASSLIRQCPNLPVDLIEMHVRRMPESYFEWHAPADVARHLRLISRLSPERRVEIEMRSLGGSSYEVCVVGYDRTGVLAAITTALAGDGLDTQDLRLATYQSEEHDEPDSALFVDVARVTAGRKFGSVAEVSRNLRDRLTVAFRHLVEGDLQKAQTAAADSGSTLGGRPRTLSPSSVSTVVREGLQLGDFRLEKKLAVGGMSEVYLATQLGLNRKAAVKIMLGPAHATPDASLQRFQKEATVLGSFTCPHIVQVLASGAAEAGPGTVLRWLAMEYLPGGDLVQRVRRLGPIDSASAVRWLWQTLKGLQYAHQRGILHRDVKPHNLLLTAEQNVKLSDFGLLKDAHQPALDASAEGAVMGTPQYIAPEQALAGVVDERSDIYSLGVSFFHLLSGRPTFQEKTTTAMLLRVSRDEVPPLLEVAPGVPRPLAILVDRMTAIRPEDRYQDVRVALEDLSSYVQRGRLPSFFEESAAESAVADAKPTDQTQVFLPPGDGTPERQSDVRLCD